MMKLLLQRGADSKHVNSEKETAFRATDVREFKVSVIVIPGASSHISPLPTVLSLTLQFGYYFATGSDLS